MSEDNVTPMNRPTPQPVQEAPKAPPQAAPIMNPTQATGVVDLNDDTVALLVWRKFMGATPMTIVVSREAWERNEKIIANHHTFQLNTVYTFESPVNAEGRQSVFHLQDVIGWAANVKADVQVEDVG